METIFQKYQGNGKDCTEGSDKGTAHSYLEIYEHEFESRRNDPVRMLEIGIFSGGSLVAWSEYFAHPSAQIVGIDIDLSMVCHRNDEDKRMRMIQIDGTSPYTPELLGGDWDIIIDDGSHFLEHQIASLRLFAPRLRVGGIYCIEDVLDIRGAPALLVEGQQLGLEGVIHDRRHIKGDAHDIMVVFHRRR